MSQPQPPPPHYMPPAAAPPGAVVETGNRKLKSLGTTCLVLAIIDICWVLYSLLSAALSPLLMQFQKDLMGPMSGGAMSDKMLEKVAEFSVTIAIWSSVRLVPFLVASVVLILIALRLRKGEIEALLSARTWVWAALGIVFGSLLINLLVILPINQELQQVMFKEMAAAGPGMPGDMETKMTAFTQVITVASMIGGGLVMAAWPIILRVWADKLLKQQQTVAEHFD